MGFIGIDRGLRDHWIYQDAEYLKVWMEMLFLARFSEEPHNELIDGDLITVAYGQFIFGRVKWSERLKISEQRLRTLITKLKKAKMIEVVDTHRKCSVYEILNYAKFNHHDNHQSSHAQQGNEDDANHQPNQHPTSSQPAANQQPTTKEQGSNKGNNVNNKPLKEYTPEFVEFWNVYPRKISKSVAFTKWKKVIKTESFDYLMQCARNYAKECEMKQTADEYIKHPATFLEKDRYKDYYLFVIGGGNGAKSQGRAQGIRYGENQGKGGTLTFPDTELDELYAASESRLLGMQ